MNIILSLKTRIQRNKLISILICVILCLVISNVFFIVKSRNPSRDSKYPLLNFSRSYIPGDNFIVNFQELRLQLQEIADNTNGAIISLYFEYLNTGSFIQINRDYRSNPASLIKVPTAMIVMKKIENGELSLDNQIVLEEKHKDPQWGNLHLQETGTKFKISDLIGYSLSLSDNTAQKMLYELITPDDASAFSKDLGLESLFDNSGKITAREYSQLMRDLYNSSYLKATSSEYLLTQLANSSETEYLRSGVPNTVKFAHKFGERKSAHIFQDSGIVYAENRPYLVTVIINYPEDESRDNDLVKEEAMGYMKKISETIYTFVATHQ